MAFIRHSSLGRDDRLDRPKPGPNVGNSASLAWLLPRNGAPDSDRICADPQATKEEMHAYPASRDCRGCWHWTSRRFGHRGRAAEWGRDHRPSGGRKSGRECSTLPLQPLGSLVWRTPLALVQASVERSTVTVRGGRPLSNRPSRCSSEPTCRRGRCWLVRAAGRAFVIATQFANAASTEKDASSFIVAGRQPAEVVPDLGRAGACVHFSLEPRPQKYAGLVRG
jgi:hypothetical protein